MAPQPEEIVHTASSALRHPSELARRIYADVRDSQDLGWQFFRRAMQVRYRESMFGVLWAFVPGVMLAVGLTLAAKARLVNIGHTVLPYPLYVILGTVLWQVFSDALNAPINAINDAKPVLTKMLFPREALFLAKIGELLFELGIKSVVVVALFLFFRVPPGPLFWVAPFALLPLVALGLAFGFMLVPFSVLFQDVVKGMMMAMTYWFFLTPLIYPVPESGLLQKIVNLNPVTPLAVTVRDLLTGTEFNYLASYYVVAPAAVLAMVLAWFVTYVSMPFLIERMSS